MKTFDFENNNPIGYVDILPMVTPTLTLLGMSIVLMYFIVLIQEKLSTCFHQKEESSLITLFKDMNHFEIDWFVLP